MSFLLSMFALTLGFSLSGKGGGGGTDGGVSSGADDLPHFTIILS